MSGNERVENSESKVDKSAETQQKLSNEALALYQCGPGGPIGWQITLAQTRS